jgi:hypothetical protein
VVVGVAIVEPSGVIRREIRPGDGVLAVTILRVWEEGRGRRSGLGPELHRPFVQHETSKHLRRLLVDDRDGRNLGRAKVERAVPL